MIRHFYAIMLASMAFNAMGNYECCNNSCDIENCEQDMRPAEIKKAFSALRTKKMLSILSALKMSLESSKFASLFNKEVVAEIRETLYASSSNHNLTGRMGFDTYILPLILQIESYKLLYTKIKNSTSEDKKLLSELLSPTALAKKYDKGLLGPISELYNPRSIEALMQKAIVSYTIPEALEYLLLTSSKVAPNLSEKEQELLCEIRSEIQFSSDSQALYTELYDLAATKIAKHENTKEKTILTLLKLRQK